MSMELYWNDIDCGGREGPKYSDINQFQRHFAHYKSHMDKPEIETGPPR